MQTQEFTTEEIADAQAALNLYPSRCAFWDSFSGQEVLEVVIGLGIVPTVSEAEVRDAYDALCDEIDRDAAAA